MVEDENEEIKGNGVVAFYRDMAPWDFNLDPVKDENGKQARGEDITIYYNVTMIGLENNGTEIDSDEWKEYGFVDGDCSTTIIEGADFFRKGDECVDDDYDSSNSW